ncbi:uncharacterized protein LOC141601195 [Silene latifolia]|uniref:uncharacterized protein LOC141601195 n=1 Tax=Silene latifolia TaxID=37657 RepID=UPI003D773297
MYQIQFLEYNALFIHMLVDEVGTGYSFYCTIVYAFNGVGERKPLWDKIRHFSDQIQIPWLVCGDFNTVLKPAERLGGNSTEEEMTDFQACVDYCDIQDSLATGSFFTWNNKQEPLTRVYCRLDRVLVNKEWLTQRPGASAHFLVEGYFDHTPCLIQNSLKHNTVRAWQHLEFVQELLRHNPTDAALITAKLAAASEYKDLQVARDSFLLQKSKATWLRDGDNNTKFFHSVIRGRQSLNRVIRIADEHGTVCTDPNLIQQAFLKFYHNLLGKATRVNPVNVSVVQRGAVCTPEHWDILLQPVSNQEIKEAVFSIPIHKAPGPDGYSSVFFRDAWSVVGDDIAL